MYSKYLLPYSASCMNSCIPGAPSVPRITDGDDRIVLQPRSHSGCTFINRRDALISCFSSWHTCMLSVFFPHIYDIRKHTRTYTHAYIHTYVRTPFNPEQCNSSAEDPTKDKAIPKAESMAAASTVAAGGGSLAETPATAQGNIIVPVNPSPLHPLRRAPVMTSGRTWMPLMAILHLGRTMLIRMSSRPSAFSSSEWDSDEKLQGDDILDLHDL